MVTAVDAVTALVLTVKVALAAPAGTVTLEGTVAAAVLPLESATCAPPAGAGPLSVTVPVEELPPVTLVGLKLRESRTRARLPVFNRTETAPGQTFEEPKFVTARSGAPSPLKSPTATEIGEQPAPKCWAAWKVPSPLPSSTETDSTGLLLEP